jgi:hypothetical protein
MLVMIVDPKTPKPLGYEKMLMAKNKKIEYDI